MKIYFATIAIIVILVSPAISSTKGNCSNDLSWLVRSLGSVQCAGYYLLIRELDADISNRPNILTEDVTSFITIDIDDKEFIIFFDFPEETVPASVDENFSPESEQPQVEISSSVMFTQISGKVGGMEEILRMSAPRIVSSNESDLEIEVLTCASIIGAALRSAGSLEGASVLLPEALTSVSLCLPGDAAWQQGVHDSWVVLTNEWESEENLVFTQDEVRIVVGMESWLGQGFPYLFPPSELMESQ
jgi:hypothetical protein